MIDKLTEMKNQLAEVLVSTKSFNEDFRAHVKAVHRSVEEGRESGRPIKSFLPRLIVSSLDADNPGQRKTFCIILPELPQKNVEKQELMAQLGIACAENGLKIVMAVFESEAWAVEEQRNPDTSEYVYVPPSERHDRKEIIFVAARSIDGRDAFARIPITGRYEDDESLILGQEVVQEFAEKREGVIQDSLLGAFFNGLIMAAAARVEAELLLALKRSSRSS